MLSYHNCVIEPLNVSDIQSRSDPSISTRTYLGDLVINIPFLNAPMATIDSPEFFRILSQQYGGIPVLHRFMSVEDQINKIMGSHWIVSVGVKEDELARIDALLEFGAKYFLIDVANGFSTLVEPIVRKLKNAKCWVMAGNVASLPGYKYLAGLGVDAVRVGLGTGSICSTRRQTGVGYPILSAIQEIDEYRTFMGGIHPAIICDGGIKEPQDVAKALVAGADACMMGLVFARCLEASPGTVMGSQKVYYGQASKYAQIWEGKVPKYIEGEAFEIRVEKTLQETMDDFLGGLRSTMSYLGCRSISDMKEAGRLVEMPIWNREGFK